MKERAPEVTPEFQTTTIKEELYKRLMEIDPIENSEEYLNILDRYEQEDLRIKQEERRQILKEKLNEKS